MDRQAMQSRLRARQAFLEEVAAGRALRERVFPRRVRKVRARQQRYLATYYSC